MLPTCRLPSAGHWSAAHTAVRARLLPSPRLIRSTSLCGKAKIQETAPLNDSQLKSLPTNSLDTPVLAERLGLDMAKLGRLILNGVTQKSTVKLGRKGVSNNLKTQLETRFRNLEVLKLEATEKKHKADMKTIRTQLEELMPIHVIWMSGSKIVAYRGKDYVKSVIEQPPQPQQQQPQPHDVPSEAFLEPS